MNGGDGVVSGCGSSSGGGNGVGTLMSDMEDSGENHKCETNSSFQSQSTSTSTSTLGGNCAAGSSSSGSSSEGHFSEESNSRTNEMSLGLEPYKPETLHQLNGSVGGGPVVFPMEASTQTTSTMSLDNPNNMTTNNFDEHCGVVSGQRQTISYNTFLC